MNGLDFHELMWLGGHGVYVWASFALCAAAVLIECLALRQARKRALRRIGRLQGSGLRKTRS
jgi:heme exporter protein CcmD